MRLIDADNLIEAMKKIETEYENEMACPSWWSALVAISEQPTAYDVDEVIRELNYALYDNPCSVSEIEWNNAFKKAIEIVKQGGVADDVCEWKSASDGEFIQNPHTKRLYSNEPSMKNVYCNTCGKKIKIVGD